MDKNSRLSLVALSVLFVATIGVGVYVYRNSNQVSADTVVTSEVSSGTPLKMGSNSIKTAIDFDLNSKVVKANNQLISVRDAQTNGIITSIKDQKSGKILGSGVSKVSAGTDIVVNVSSIATDPVMMLDN